MKFNFNSINFPKPYIIAEIGVNHECSIKNAYNLIEQAKKGGAHAVKFQTYKAEKLASKNSPAYWDTKKEKTKNQYDLFKKFDHFNYKDYLKLVLFCKKKKIQFLSTPFDEDAVDFLNKHVPVFKIASADITNLPLLEKIASTKKPVIISTGASTIAEIKKAILPFKKKGNKNICLMHCILNYPTLPKNANLLMIKHLKKIFPKLTIGYSDHTLPDDEMSSITTAYLLGAEIIEKHFTNKKTLKGNDHYHSMDYKDLLKININLSNLKNLIGKSKIKSPINSEKLSRKNARRSLVAKVQINKNEKFKYDNIICKRPGLGISPMNIKKVLGKKTKKTLKKDTIIKFKHIKKY